MVNCEKRERNDRGWLAGNEEDAVAVAAGGPRRREADKEGGRGEMMGKEGKRTRMKAVQPPSQRGEDRMDPASLGAEFHGP